MWTPATREKYSRRRSQYQSDVTGAEWWMVEPRIPAPKLWGRPRVAGARDRQRDLLCDAIHRE